MVQRKKQKRPQLPQFIKSPAGLKVLDEITNLGLSPGRPAIIRTGCAGAARLWPRREKCLLIKKERLYFSTSQPSPSPTPGAGP